MTLSYNTRWEVEALLGLEFGQGSKMGSGLEPEHKLKLKRPPGWGLPGRRAARQHWVPPPPPGNLSDLDHHLIYYDEERLRKEESHEWKSEPDSALHKGSNSAFSLVATA